MTRDDVKELIKQVISDMSTSYGIENEIAAAPANVTTNISRYDATAGPKIRRKLKDFEYTDEEDEEIEE